MHPIKGTVTEVPEGVEWRIPDFLSLPNDWYDSPTFSFAAASWRLEIAVHGTTYKKSREIFMYLMRTTPGPPIHLGYCTGVKSGKYRGKYRRTQHTVVFNSGRVSLLCHSYLDSRQMSEWLHIDGTLTVLCTFKHRNVDAAVSSGQIRKFSESEERQTRKRRRSGSEQDFSSAANGEYRTPGSSSLLNKNKVLLDLKELFLKKEDCDVVIKVKGREFPAHKSILKARSPVFASTFRCDMKEKETGIVDVEDCDPTSFSDFLCYLYCGTVENLSEQNVFSLFAAADKYDVQDLRAECLQFINENLSIDTFCDTLTLALRHSETELIQLTTDFFTKNAPEIIVTVKWQNFSADNPTESNELFIKLLVPNKN